MGWMRIMAITSLIQLGKYYYPEPGGMETHLYNLCCRLKTDYDIQVLVANRKPKTMSEVIHGVKVLRVANLGELFSSPVCPTMPYHLSQVSSEGDTIIQIHLPNPMAHFAYLLAKPAGRLVIMWHSDIIRQKLLAKPYYWYLHRLLERADCIIASSLNYVKYSPFLKNFADKCIVIPLGINVKDFFSSPDVLRKAESIRQKYGERLVLFVGRFTYYKGLEGLIKAAHEIHGKILLVGDGPLKKKLQKLALKFSLSNKVFFLQDVSNEDLVSYYHACDLFVLPSNRRSEAFGIVQLEAMVCKKPTVSTNLKTGVPWVNQHGQTGLVVPVDDFEKLASAVNYLLENDSERRRLGKNARRRVLQNFTLDKFTKKMDLVFKQVLDGGIKDAHFVSLEHLSEKQME